MDTIGDMLTKIRNAQAVKKETVSISYSKLKMEIIKILAREKFLKEAEQKGKKNKKIIDVVLAYDSEKNPAINHIARISKPSRRIYLPLKKIKPVRRGLGLQIISTAKGILSDKEARKEKVGGEILCEIW
ncbi:MAG: 30S ribosomal protein S8 [Candidatus Parcubacteria bacterium]|nr:30S ribosomal protein S8 [Candidatus Parcubacteria bacterium]